MIQIAITNGSVEFDGTPLLTEINFSLNEKDKIALVGRNGCGKTTLLKVLTNQIEMVKGTGESNLKYIKTGNPVIGHLEQAAFDDEKTSLIDEIRKPYYEVINVENSMNNALLAMEKDCSNENINKYSNLMERFERLGGYTYEKEYLTGIHKFGFTNDDLKKKLTQFSGGERTKIALLKLLLSKPDVLLLDEPTNHLDIDAIMWLENYLKNYKNTCVIVSHDRMFLDRAVNVVYEIEFGEMTRYKGNYTDFVRQKKENYEKALKDSEAKKKEIARLQKLVDRFRYKATKASMAQSKLKQIARMGSPDEVNRYDMRTFHTLFQPQEQSALRTIMLNKLQFGYNKTSIGEITLNVFKNDKIGIIGSNGSGKSTLIHTIMDMIPKISGSVTFGLNSKVGYFDQTLTQSVSEKTLVDDFIEIYPNLSITQARSSLGSFQFCGEDALKRICDLSGGEKVRFALCKLLKIRPNILILDEPTNHMDIVGKETLENMLIDYRGTILVVSHDRYLINKVCNKLIVFSDNGAKFYDCNYAEYEKQIINNQNI